MHLKKIYFIPLLLLIFITNCASNFGASETQDFGRYLSIKEGVSSKTDIFDSFGQPGDVRYLSSDESVWSYYATKMTMNAATFIPIIGMVAGGSNADTQISRFYFDSSNTLIKVETSSKAQYVNMWVGMGTAFVNNDYMQRIEDEMAKFELPFDQSKAVEIKGMHQIVE